MLQQRAVKCIYDYWHQNSFQRESKIFEEKKEKNIYKHIVLYFRQNKE